MTTIRQGDLFTVAAGPAAYSASETPDPEAIRTRLQALLALLRDAAEVPWAPSRARAQEYLFMNMAAWLPQAERDALRRDFAAEMARLRVTGTQS
jgi:hypothetical protein